MDRDTAVARIRDGLGFRPSGWAREASIILRLQEAQRNLQKGKTLPKFLLQQDATIALAGGGHTAPYPTGFLRISDDTRLRYFAAGSEIPTFLSERLYVDAVSANQQAVDSTSLQTLPTAPSVYVFRPLNIDFVVKADRNYTLYLDYYKAGALLTTNIQNEWLADDAGGEWLIGEAGYRMAKDIRDKDGMSIFDDMRTAGRAALFGELLASETQSQPLRMGANL